MIIFVMLFTIYKDCFKTHLHKMSRFWHHFGRVAKNLLILSEWVFYNGCLLRKRRRFNIVANNLFLLQIINSLDNFWRWNFGNFQKFLEFHKVFRTPLFLEFLYLILTLVLSSLPLVFARVLFSSPPFPLIFPSLVLNLGLAVVYLFSDVQINAYFS